MEIGFSNFITSAAGARDYPPAELPEIAFAGRSNVGKSSLINKLVNRKKLVKTSSTPGRTRLLNFFNAGDKYTLVDLPGYGYAKASKAEKKKWGPMIEGYLVNREILVGVVLIVDIRRTPQAKEIEFLDWFDFQKINYIIAATKADKLSKQKQQKNLDIIAKTLGMKKSDIVLFSSKTGLGKDMLWERIADLCGEITTGP